jgi:hypothetical protein
VKRRRPSNFSFVCPSSSDHFAEAKVAVQLAQKFFPEHKILFYDLGLNNKQVAQMKSVCPFLNAPPLL